MDFTQEKDLKVAVIGSGISGICCAYLLQHQHQVSLFEKNDYYGGHTHTVIIPDGPDKGVPVDTGFIVLNERTYPNFISFLERLGVEKSPTDMSFSYYCEKSGLSYASRNLNTIFTQRTNLLRPRFLRFVYEMTRYLSALRKEYVSGHLPEITLSEYLNRKGLHREVIDWFIIPMAASIWSGSDFQMGQFPIRTFAQFYENHGLLSLTGHPPWFYVKGGSHTYVKAFLSTFKGQAFKNRAVTGISRSKDKVTLKFENTEPQIFDAVVIAAHADQALRLLEDPDSRESKLLGAWTYSRNQTLLHTDARVMPPNKRAWASWNYTRFSKTDTTAPVGVSYDMTRLQKLESRQSYFVTLNPQKPIPEKHIIKTLEYTHPQYSFDAFESQKGLELINGHRRTFFCGAYFGYGFHEDGVNSALNVARQFGEAL